MQSISVIVSSYDHPNALTLCLEGLRHQDLSNFEIVLADDGSDIDTFDLVEEFIREGMPILVTTQPDEGFRTVLLPAS